jgi:hypothetical protein
MERDTKKIWCNVTRALPRRCQLDTNGPTIGETGDKLTSKDQPSFHISPAEAAAGRLTRFGAAKDVTTSITYVPWPSMVCNCPLTFLCWTVEIMYSECRTRPESPHNVNQDLLRAADWSP